MSLSTLEMKKTSQTEVSSFFSPEAEVVVSRGDCLTTLRTLPRGFAKLIITSPPYNLGKVYEKSLSLEQYLAWLNPIIDELVAILSDDWSLCWQVGNTEASAARDWMRKRRSVCPPCATTYLRPFWRDAWLSTAW